MAGIPILAGFFGKLFLFTQALNQGYYVMVVIAVITSIISIYYYLKVIITMFTYKNSDAKTTYPKNFIYADRKSTRLNSSHVKISYAVFCLKKKNTKIKNNNCNNATP